MAAQRLTGPGIYRTANGRRVTWSVGNHGFRFGGEHRLILSVENSTGEGEFSLTYRTDGTPCDGFRPSLNTPEFHIVLKESSHIYKLDTKEAHRGDDGQR